MEISYNKDITDRTTFGVRVRCAAFAEYENVDDLLEALKSNALPRPFLFIGGGSNLLFTSDFPGTVLHSKIRYIRKAETLCVNADCAKKSAVSSGGDEVLVEVGSGVVFDDFCEWAAENGLWGIENLSHIPGEVGASAVQNVGAYGVEAGELIRKVRCINVETLQVVEIDASECHYGYRYSCFKDDWKGRYVIVSVVFALSSRPTPRLDYGHLHSAVAETVAREASLPDNRSAASIAVTPMLVRRVVTEIRRGKLPEPSELGSAGSFFKNPVVPESVYGKICEEASGETVPHYIVPQDDGSVLYKIPAAWMIECCGWKGKTVGKAAVYEKQPLVIVNVDGEASADDIMTLENAIVESVKFRFGVTLKPEVEHI